MGFCKKTKGAIAVFMSLIILLVFVFGCLIVDGTRILSAKSIILGAGDLAMNGALANYDTKLKDMYGLMGMKEIPEDLSKYFNHSINAATLNDSGKKIWRIDSAGYRIFSAEACKWITGVLYRTHAPADFGVCKISCAACLWRRDAG